MNISFRLTLSGSRLGCGAHGHVQILRSLLRQALSHHGGVQQAEEVLSGGRAPPQRIPPSVRVALMRIRAARICRCHGEQVIDSSLT